MSLADESCIACKGGTPKLTLDEAKPLLTMLDGWFIPDRYLLKRIEFKNFSKALDFVNRVGAVAEQERHHPDITFGWGYVELKITTHSTGGLTRNDFILAAKIDALLVTH